MIDAERYPLERANARRRPELQGDTTQTFVRLAEIQASEDAVAWPGWDRTRGSRAGRGVRAFAAAFVRWLSMRPSGATTASPPVAPAVSAPPVTAPAASSAPSSVAGAAHSTGAVRAATAGAGDGRTDQEARLARIAAHVGEEAALFRRRA